MSDVTIIILGFVALLLIILAYLATVAKSLTSMANQVRQSWEPVREQCSNRVDFLNGVQSLVDEAPIMDSNRQILTEFIERAKNAYATAYKGFDPESAGIAEAILEDRLIPSVDKVLTDGSIAPTVARMKTSLETGDRAFDQARDTYNKTVLRYNRKVVSFPERWVAKALNYDEMEIVSTVSFNFEEETGQ